MTPFDTKNALKNHLREELDDMRHHVTENWEAINTLREENKKYREVFEALPQRFFLKDERLRYLLCSKSFASDLNRNVDEIIGRYEEDLFPAELANVRIQQEMRILQSGQSEEAEEIRFIDGEQRVFITVKAPTNGNGGVSGIFGVSVDSSKDRHKVVELHQIIRQMESLIAGQSERIASMQSNLEHLLSEMKQQEEGFKGLRADYEKQMSLKDIELERLRNALHNHPIKRDERLQMFQKIFHELKNTVDGVKGYLDSLPATTR